MKPIRLYVIFFCIIGAYATLGIRLYDLQIRQGDFYFARAESQYRLAGFFEPHRGIIYITDKRNAKIPVATNISQRVVFAVPNEIKDIDTAVENLSPIIGAEANALRATLAKKGAYRIILKDPTDEQVVKISEANIVGVYIDTGNKRSYPLGTLAAHIIGFVSPGENDHTVQGRYGIEKEYEVALAGTPGSFNDTTTADPLHGADITLTIDQPIQKHAETILKRLVAEKKAAGGSIIVQEPATGKILAMTSIPDFNPNRYAEYPLATFTNPTVQARYEPGSVFKVLTAAIGLDTKTITPDMTYYDTGKLVFSDGKTVNNWDLKAYGTVTMTNVIEKSLNTGAAFMEKKIGHKKFYDYLVKFGLNAPTDIGLPGEVSGNLKNIKTHTADIDFAAASFGQGVAVTPLQLITAISTIANGGNLIQPSIVVTTEPRAIRRVLSPEAARQTVAMMVSAVDKAKIAQIANYTVAGKTGTAQAVDFTRGGYTKEVINTYVGFAPAYNPRFVALVKLDMPAGAPLAGVTVVPAFRELAQFILDYYAVPPDVLKLE